MRAGVMDRRASFYAKVSTRDAYNASVDSWPLVTLETWAQVKPVGGNLVMSNEEKFYTSPVTITTRYRSDIVETMRVKLSNYPNNIFRITMIDEVGRKVGLSINLEKINE